MSLTKLTNDLDIIRTLDNEPNDVSGMTADELKAKFDEAGNLIKEFINNTLTPEADIEFNKKVDITDLENNRKLSASGNFTGTLNGMPIVQDQTGLSTTVAYHTTQINKIKSNLNGDLELIAHRGFASLYPENTLYSARKAIKLGASPECDVQFTQDGQMVVIHDSTVDRTTNGTGVVKNLTYSYISGLDAGTDFNSYFAGVHVPLFADYLDAVQNAKHIYVELKDYRTAADIITFVQTIIDKGFEDRCTIQCFYYSDVLSYIRSVSSKIRVGCLVENQLGFDNNFGSLVVYDNNSMMLIPSTIATLANLQICKQYNIEVGVWTIDTITDLNPLVRLGYTKLMCNRYLEVTL